MDYCKVDDLPKDVRNALRRAVKKSTSFVKLLEPPKDLTLYTTIELSCVYRVSYDIETGKIYRMHQITPHW
jgi:hypothetical protein